MSKESAYIIGVAGGSGAGKTTLVEQVVNKIGANRVLHLEFDNYYKPTDHLSSEERQQRNYDHPDSLDIELFAAHLQQLKSLQPVIKPQVNISEESRAPDTTAIEPKQVVIAEGILLFHFALLSDLLDLKVFVDTPPDIRFIRRLQRDTSQWGRSLDAVIEQYLTTVKPMHSEFVEPSKKQADVIFSYPTPIEKAVEILTSKILTVLQGE